STWVMATCGVRSALDCQSRTVRTRRSAGPEACRAIDPVKTAASDRTAPERASEIASRSADRAVSRAAVAGFDAGQHLLQLGARQGLDEVAVEAGVGGPSAIGLQPISREGDEDDVVAAGHGPDAPGDLVAVEAGQADVDQRDVDR